MVLGPLRFLLLHHLTLTVALSWGELPWRFCSKSTKLFGSEKDELEPLSLSANDLERITRLRSLRKTIPVMILDPMLPGQKLEFSVKDKRFRVLASRLKEEPVLGMLGFDPATNEPLKVGVTLKINNLNIDEKSCTISIEGHEQFQVESDLYFDDDDTESYYVADIEMVEQTPEVDLTPQHMAEAKSLHDEIPDLVQDWIQLLYKTGHATPESMKPRLPAPGIMPSEIRDRSIWVGALINPLPGLGVCLEIRPSMLLCRTDLERVRLAHASLKSSIDHLSGKQKLF
mmetsp:Transcript_9757/g.14310  ORF Transcript_9757/g.14310 Transcript_9757/m.14310 type:complete len:286 (-) Transcript_9757:2321-3178(-)|eukprot:CAMPEP_0194207906 /NCGR_PEP_ID=MMETSP0156-20130528/6526_1 /TAXON_ID=33649 /ORGANISM="Thalassionema nitzschioides, Strain L26-B" /LENGTH=285 /DNA_ID=CAMNT_0038934777 /DNA_START=40 /DNA_END=897 /DNA_ORIENTATION=-